MVTLEHMRIEDMPELERLKVREVEAMCPRCKAIEEITLYSDRSISSSAKFRLKDGAIYHCCGSRVKLFRM